MGKVTGFIEIERHDRTYKSASDRIRNYKEFVIPLEERDLERQAARCMDCGIPFCHNGCPVNNQIPDWNDLVYQSDWEQASHNLHSTNNFPEFTGRICPAPCEAACTLNIDGTPVTIKTIECAIVDRAWEECWIAPHVPETGTGKKLLSSDQALPEWRRRSSSRVSAMMFIFMKRTRPSADFFATAFPISRWKNISSTGAPNRWLPKALLSTAASMSVSI